MLQKIAYLTVDDSPSKDAKQKADFLVSKNIPAIWFCQGYLLEINQKLAKYLIKKKFILGNHAYDHPHFSELPLKDCFEQIKKTDQIIDSLYQKVGAKRPAKVFRFPYGDKGGGKNVEQKWLKNEKKFIQSIQNFLKDLGYRQPKFEGINYQWYNQANLLKDIDVYWTYNCMEYAIFNPKYGIRGLKEVLERMDENVPEGCRGLNFMGPNEIILIHDHPETTKMFIPIIEKLMAKGLKFELPKFE